MAPIAGPLGAPVGVLGTIALNASAGLGGYLRGGCAGNAVNALTGGRAEFTPTWEGALFTAAGAAAGGAIGEALSPMIGVHTMRQLFRFAPRTWQAFWRQGINMQALEGSAFVGGIWSSGIAVLGEPRGK